jgi:hypothetical protein
LVLLDPIFYLESDVYDVLLKGSIESLVDQSKLREALLDREEL